MGRGESLQDLYLDLCRLRALASGEGSDDKFPEKYFRNIFVDALNDRDFRKAVLVQNPGTMEEAYRVATQLEAIDAYNTPVADTSRVKPRVRQIDYGVEDTAGSNKKVDSDENLARRIVELENEVQSLRAGALRQASYFPNVPPNRQVRPPVQNPRPMWPVISYVVVVLSAVLTNSMFREIEKYEEPGLANRIVSIVGNPDISVETAESPDIRHISQDEELSFHNRTTPQIQERGPPGNLKGLTSQSKIRREAYLDVQMGDEIYWLF